MKNVLKLSIISCIFMSILLVGCGRNIQKDTKGGLVINNWSSGIGSVSEATLDQTKFSYSINLTNENQNTIYLTSIQPIVKEKNISRVINSDIVVYVDQEIEPNESIEIKGELIFDTNGLTKQEILDLDPFITDIKFSSEELISLSK